MLDSFRLRVMQERDLRKVLEWRNSDRIRDMMINDHEISWEEHTKWFHRQELEATSVHLIFENGNDPMGVVNFTQFNAQHRSCYWGFYLGEKGLPRGTGTIMGQLALRYVFEELGVRKLCAEVLESNLVSRAFHVKLGFQQEGVLRKHICKKGRYEDLVCFALFGDEYTRGDDRH